MGGRESYPGVGEVVGGDEPAGGVGAGRFDGAGGAVGGGGYGRGAAGHGFEVDHAEGRAYGRGDHEVGAAEAGGQFFVVAPADLTVTASTARFRTPDDITAFLDSDACKIEPACSCGPGRDQSN
nr:hypothetical protein [Streptomyces sp. MnatMP-M27]